MKVIVLGGGLVGGPMARDLASDPEINVTVADLDEQILSGLTRSGDIETLQVDLSCPERVRDLVSGFDLVLGAVPGHLGFQTLQSVIEAGRSVVDIAFFAEDPFELDGLAREKGVTAIVDCGVFPGMGSALIGKASREFDTIDSVTCYVGGLPEIRRRPWEYRAVFSPVDVIEEYVRPARYVQNGVVEVRPALSDPELIEFAGVGTLEAFNTDGLRTLMRTIAAPNMKEKTLRYPGHIEKIALLRDCGFFADDPLDLPGGRIRPLDLTARLLFPMWKMQPEDRDITVMRIIIEGRKGSGAKRRIHDLLDRFDTKNGVTSMARTTGYTATMAVRMLASGRFSRKGICPPEYMGLEQGCVSFLLEGLASRGIHYGVREESAG